MNKKKTTQVFPGYDIVHLGEVWVDSATITITDCMVPFETDEGWVVVPSGQGDGKYPVYGFIKKDEGGFERVCGAFVDFDNIISK